MPLLYIVCQSAAKRPAVSEWIDEAWRVVSADQACNEWGHRIIRADPNNGFKSFDVFSSVKEKPGPLILLGQLKHSSVAILQSRLAKRYAVIHRVGVTDSTDVYQAMTEAMTHHINGEPTIPVRLVVALLLIRKLKLGNFWGGGAMAKAFLSVHELAKGRGLDEKYRPYAAEVANTLQLKGLLKRKTGDGNAKYALNSARSKELHEFLRSWRVEDDGLQTYLYGSRETVSARELDRLAAEIDSENEVCIMGARGLHLTDEECQSRGIDCGIYVRAVDSGSPAQEVIFAEDVLISIDGNALQDSKILITIIGQRQGKSVEFVVLRGKQQVCIAIQLVPWPTHELYP